MSRAFRQNSTQKNTYYPQLLGTHGAVATEHQNKFSKDKEFPIYNYLQTEEKREE